MSRPRLVAVFVFLVMALSSQVCCGCSVEEGCLQFSDLLSNQHYETIRGDMISSTVTQYPDIVIDNPSSKHLTHEERSLISLHGSGVVEGAKWWLMSLGVSEYEEWDLTGAVKTSIPPHTSWIIRQLVVRIDREATIKGYYAFYCWERDEVWEYCFFECPAREREAWTSTSLATERLPQ